MPSLTADGQEIHYDVLIVCPGIKLDWAAIDGLPQSIGQKWCHVQLPL
jgi:sulfide:quinone oxidoreductase